ncbi:WecB/TagA/CpsF family glycosyltransferase [Maledivibacter halophilus]|uniref:N-acetylglucosaminyldiphosphoundecaprenol N-acetyl-beta-D-mannosaminyltransferase n=1 Tax=Maledivibacter halophilus TaxID=36842 RepID=A0A1T5JHS2_9FIRM|nr:WecB/TagA/CpsF family glycosyltransferase [Maledivibacter halophilus]SKC50713.1 N-acetylmannosaminyltransferase [Maledivibacter halophilus]
MRKTTKIYGSPIDIVTMESAVERFKQLLDRSSFSFVCTPNTEIVMMAKEDEELTEVLKLSDMNIPDGIGLIIASKIHRLGLVERVTGIDLMGEILKFCNYSRKSIYIFGGKPGVAKRAVHNILEKYPGIEVKGYRNGYFKKDEEKNIIENINKLSPDILFVALGAPKQEKWIYKHRKELKAKIAMGVGGCIDIWAGTAKRAPKIFRILGLEWFYRLIKEPSRFKRMMVLPKFMIKVLTSKNISN